jgi:hypothetical protein
MTTDQAPDKKPGRAATLVAALIGGVALLAAFLANVKTIAEFFEPLFGTHATDKGGGNPLPHKVTRVCMGEGGGTNCSSGAGASYDCDAYKAMGGGAKQTYDTLADRFCGYTDSTGAHTVYNHNIVVYQNNGGGKCGWTGFEVTCN